MSGRFDYVLSRIIGNELPLRDEPGGRLEAYKFIIMSEPPLPGVFKRWVINRVYNQEYLADIVNLLLEHEQSFTINPFIGTEYRKCKTRDAKTIYAINANIGRNFVLNSRHLADYSLVLDGECMFTEKAWKQVTVAMKQYWSLKYFSVPMKRVHAEKFYTVDHETLPLEEPQLIFRSDSEMLFNENMVYPVHDKCELLWRLGHSHGHKMQHILDRTDQCASAGYVLHINTGSEGVETHLTERDAAREAGKDLLLKAIDEEYGCRA